MEKRGRKGAKNNPQNQLAFAISSCACQCLWGVYFFYFLFFSPSPVKSALRQITSGPDVFLLGFRPDEAKTIKMQIYTGRERGPWHPRLLRWAPSSTPEVRGASPMGAHLAAQLAQRPTSARGAPV